MRLSLLSKLTCLAASESMHLLPNVQPVILSAAILVLMRLGAAVSAMCCNRLGYTPTFHSSMWMLLPMSTSSALSLGTPSVRLTNPLRAHDNSILCWLSSRLQGLKGDC